ncbi:hypothetical protein WJX74_003034 [Apatococcus lobatus]|uniref:Plastid lipid-associated protein/fibrillin conserved domain-containing protein n=1 Tax=Apatococcus lobatus TaxID=904363 RepID=A0AAW1RBX9_9CHLO
MSNAKPARSQGRTQLWRQRRPRYELQVAPSSLTKAGILERIGQLFQRPGLSQVALEQQELLDLLDSPAADEARIDELIDILGNSKQPFTEASIGGGPWQVVYTKGPLLWQQLTSPGAGGKRVRQGGSQEFIPEGRRLVNFGSLLGGLASVSANGTYELQEDGEASPNLPKTIMAKVAGGSAKIGDLQIPLPIKGTGTVDLLYIDNSIRIFQNSQGSRVVQRKASM